MDTAIPVAAEQKMAALEKWMAPLFAKFPHLPESARQTIANIAPWIALIFGALGLLALLSAGAMATLFSFASVVLLANGITPLVLLITVIAGIIACALELLAFKPLGARRKKGWNYLFYGTVLTTAATLLNMAVGYGSLGSLVGSLIGFWLLFEVRGLYHS
ncbi:MAG: hypothetical protein WCV62_01925 [Candidatus Peribacteraceae bacterium]|jgi:hypothetical protein